MLILTLIDVQYSQKAVEKALKKVQILKITLQVPFTQQKNPPSQ